MASRVVISITSNLCYLFRVKTGTLHSFMPQPRWIVKLAKEQSGSKQCTRCKEAKLWSEFYWQKDGYAQSHCKQCLKEATSLSRQLKPNKAKWAEYQHRSSLRRRYGLEPAQYQALLSAYAGKCWICQSKTGDTYRGKTSRLSVDHDHATGHVRGLLCSSCNNGLGRFKHNIDLLEKAIDYLKKEPLQCQPKNKTRFQKS